MFNLLISLAAGIAVGVIVALTTRLGAAAAVIPGTVVAGWIGDLFPFGHAADLFSSVLYDADPAGVAGRETAWLVILMLGYGLLARLWVRRLVV